MAKEKTLRTPWYDETIKALQINGKSDKTQEAYARAVRMLIEYFGKEPDQTRPLKTNFRNTFFTAETNANGPRTL